MIIAATYNLATSPQAPINPQLLNQSVNALTKPGYLRYVCSCF